MWHVRLYRWYAGIGNEPRIAVAQAVHLQRQLPLLYGLLVINSLAVAITHYGEAPTYLTVAAPALLFTVSITRMTHWWRRSRTGEEPTPEDARRRLRTITLFAALVATAYAWWLLLLMRYGGTFEQTHATIYLTTTVIGCIFCLIPLPQLALLVAGIVIPMFAGFCLIRQQPTYTIIAVNVTLVVVVLLRVLFNSFDYFRSQVAAQAELERQHAELMRLNEENDRLARTDSLTGLPNRRRFQQDLERLAARGGGAPFAVGLLDLDRFKPVNDTYGHHVGDILLKELSRRVRETVGMSATFYRLGGDEFGLLVPGDAAAATTLGHRICQGFEQPFTVGELRICVGGSLGLALFPTAGDTGAALFDRADYALYHAKRVDGGGMCVFTPNLETAIRRDRAIEAALQSCVFDNELRIVAQPIVHARTGTVQALEVLARWRSPLLGDVAPSDFIAVAERSTLIHSITLTVFRKGLAAARDLPGELALSFNISACDLHSPATIAGIEREVAESGIAPSRIWIEVTETAVMRDAQAAARVLGRLRDLGMKVALDDFGTGYSSLSNLHQLPLDKVKIDRSFMVSAEATRGWAVVESVVGLCRALELQCVAEGVETATQLEALLRIGCEQAQGFLFAEPLPVERLADLDPVIGHRAAA